MVDATTANNNKTFVMVPRDAFEFDCTAYPDMEALAIKFCMEIAGKKGGPACPPDPVRLLEMAAAMLAAATPDKTPTIDHDAKASEKRPTTPLARKCTAIADKVVPEYRGGGRGYSCTGTIAKRWGAAYEAAALAFDLVINEIDEFKTDAHASKGE